MTAIVSVLGALAPTDGLLIAARLAKGIAAGFLAPAALSIITTNWSEGAARGRAPGWYATVGASGFVSPCGRRHGTPGRPCAHAGRGSWVWLSQEIPGLPGRPSVAQTCDHGRRTRR
ncbi:hypothetical protein NE236_36425 [Actinoallomurus purpureus]|uniref:hypothetical protein n=1 Tax=Actinoallomurus purpureus TaxID=478114 RepID=UPI002092B90E|nr:hypothetical protein [Actinoallomurus purpureus]MCO6010460.1 hypothetical protein [Actinoallomurus purpureus]